MSTTPFWHDVETIWVDGNVRYEDIRIDISVRTFVI